MKQAKKKSGISRLLEIAGRRKGLLIVSGVTATIHAMFTMIPYVLMFYIIRELLVVQIVTPVINTYLVWALKAVIVSFLLMFISGMASHIAAFNILYELRVKIADKLGKLPMGYVGSKSSGLLKKILADDVERIETFIAHGIPDTVKAIMLPVITLTYLFIADWRLALISFVPLFLVMITINKTMLSEKRKAGMKKYHTSLEDMNAGIVEFVRAMPVMKIFGQSATAFKRYSGTVDDYDLYVKKWTKLSAPIWGMILSFLNNALLPILAFGMYLYLGDSLSLPVFFLFLILGVGYIKPVFALMTLSTQIVMISRGVERIDEILLGAEEQKSGQDKIPEEFSLGFDNVCFSYIEGLEVIKNVSFKVPQGSITALVGPSGSGKSTLGQLIARFYDVKSGVIKLGGTNINNLRTEELMKNVGFVFQDNMMFYQTIKENILMGMDKTDEEIIQAAKVARCHDFITQLPDGYDTHFGNKGIHLSGGEQQRIQLARVVLKNPPVLVFDEATAFSDPENEHFIMEALSELIKEKTVIVIAHRLSTVAEVEQIVLLNNGEVEAKGTHAELLAGNKLYNKMWDAHMRVNEFEIVNKEVA